MFIMDKAQKFVELTKAIEKSSKVNSFDTGEIREAAGIALGLLDMEESFLVIMNKFIPILASENITEEIVDETLFNIGEELRHILYHINDMRYYAYIKE